VSIKMNYLLSFCHRVAYATLISALVWIFANLPMPEGVSHSEDWLLQIASWLDYPIAAASQIMPCDENALDMWFRVRCPELGYGTFSLREYLFNHMRIGIPVYLLILYLPSIYHYGRGWWRRRRRVRSSALPESSKSIASFKKSSFLGFCHRVAYAALLSALVWILFVDIPLRGRILYPKDWFTQVVLIWLDLPIAAATQFLSCDQAAVDCWFRVWCPELNWPTQDYFYNHMRIGIPTYLMIFYLPSICRYGRDWWRQRRGAALKPAE